MLSGIYSLGPFWLFLFWQYTSPIPFHKGYNFSVFIISAVHHSVFHITWNVLHVVQTIFGMIISGICILLQKSLTSSVKLLPFNTVRSIWSEQRGSRYALAAMACLTGVCQTRGLCWFWPARRRVTFYISTCLKNGTLTHTVSAHFTETSQNRHPVGRDL